jgi:hypothetical protein
LVKAIRSVSIKYWEKTSSFFAIDTAQDLDTIAARCKVAIAPSKDLVLVLDANNKAGRITGKNDDQDIFLIIPYVKKF